MVFRIRLTPQAKKDASAILQWLLSQHAGESGLRWFWKMENAIESLCGLPGRCKPAPENRSVPFEMRQLLYRHKPHLYRILFTVEGNVVQVLRIRQGRRKHLAPQ
jgi:plasmid stabilization system protein ParE